MTAPKPVFEHTDLLITRRAIDRLLLLSPNPVVNKLLLYLLAYYSEKWNIKVYAFVALSNHIHYACHDTDGIYPEFCREFHSVATRAINCSRGRFESMWSPDRQDPVILYDDEALLDKIAYVIANACLSHLVERPEDWPGVVTLVDQLCGASLEITRPEVFFDPDGDYPDVVTLELVKPERFADWTTEQYRAEISRRVEEKVAEARAERRRLGIPVVGRLKVLAQDPNSRPKTRAPYRGRRPLIACSNAELRVRLIEWLQQFRIMHREVRLEFEAGSREVSFPFGTYLHRRRYGVDCSALGPPPIQV